jgi:hypothetical protein
MKNLAYIPAILVVTALLGVLALRLFRKAEAVGRNGMPWIAAFLATWLGVLAAAAWGVRWGYERQFHAQPSFWVVFVPAAALAFAAALALGWWLGRSSERKPSARKPAESVAPAPAHPTPPPSPTPIPTPSPTAEPAASYPPEPPPVTAFKFACPHCGQRLAVTTADVGSTADCPNCAAPLTIPEPERAHG